MSVVNVEQALELLRQGEVVALPTETVYGLAGRIDSEAALQKIFSTKQRPFFDPLIVHVPDVAQAKSLGLEWPEVYESLTKHFWPGPLTLLLKKTAQVSPLITSGLDTVAVRCPRHSVALEILRRLGQPLAAPSANRFGRTSPTTAEHVTREFGGQIPVVDGGPCEVGVESTVLQVEREGTKWFLTVLRPGGISRQALREVLQAAKINCEVRRAESERAPGHLKAHYQPVSPLVLLENKSLTPDVRRTCENRLGRSFTRWTEVNLSATPQESARRLYGELHRLSTTHTDALWITRTTQHTGEEWEVVWDRIERAASLSL